MGIKSLSVILNSKCKGALNKRNLDSYRGMIFGIDISIFLYKFLYNNNDHLEGITRLLLRIIKNGILPVVIFDGRPPKEKNDVLVSRKEKRDYLVTKKEVIERFVMEREGKSDEEVKEDIRVYQEQLNKSDNSVLEDEDMTELLTKSKDELREELDKTMKRIIYVRAEHIESLKTLLTHMGLPYIVSKGEAESLMGHLCRDGILDGCISEDTDVLVNGGKIFLRNVVPDKNVVDEYCLEGILGSLEMSYEEFMDMCILCGCDYTTKIGGMGPQTAYKLMKKHGNIEGVIGEISERPDKYQIPDGEGFNFQMARHLFVHSSDNEDREEIRGRIKLMTPNMSEMNLFLRNTKLHEKYFTEINGQYINYIREIKKLLPEESRECILPQVVETQRKNKTVVDNTNKKITDFFNKK